MTFLELKNEVGDNIIDAPAVITNSLPHLVNRAIRTAMVKHNFYVMEAEQAFTVAEGSRGNVVAASDWKVARGKPYVENPLADGPVTELVIAMNLREARKVWGEEDTGAPEALVETQTAGSGAAAWQVWPLPDDDYDIVVPYWKYLPSLSLDSDTNWFTVNGEEYIIARATAIGFAKDWNENRAAYWEAKAVEHWTDLVNADKRRRLGAVTEWVPTGMARAAKLGR